MERESDNEWNRDVKETKYCRRSLQSSITLKFKESHSGWHKRIVENLSCNFTDPYICDGSQQTMDDAWACYLTCRMKMNNGRINKMLTSSSGYLASSPSVLIIQKGGIFNAG